jgi:hypothetical protein
MEALEGDEDQDEDPEVLEEIDRRQEEIIEEFMELSLNTKHDLSEKLGETEISPEDLKA